MGVRKVKVFEDLPFEEGKTYKTKFHTGEMFTITKIRVDKNGKQVGIEGIYEKSPHLGACPLNIDRLIADKREAGEKDVCDHCGHDMDVKSKGKYSPF